MKTMSLETPGLRRYGKGPDATPGITPSATTTSRRKQILSTPLSTRKDETPGGRYNLTKSDPTQAGVRGVLFEEEDEEDVANSSWSSVDSQVRQTPQAKLRRGERENRKFNVSIKCRVSLFLIGAWGAQALRSPSSHTRRCTRVVCVDTQIGWSCVPFKKNRF